MADKINFAEQLRRFAEKRGYSVSPDPKKKDKKEESEKYPKSVQKIIDLQTKKEVKDVYQKDVKRRSYTSIKLRHTSHQSQRTTFVTNICTIRRYKIMSQLNKVQNVDFDPLKDAFPKFVMVAILVWNKVVEDLIRKKMYSEEPIDGIAEDEDKKYYMYSKAITDWLIWRYPTIEKVKKGNTSWEITKLYEQIEENPNRGKEALGFILKEQVSTRRYRYIITSQFQALTLGQVIALRIRGKNAVTLEDALAGKDAISLAIKEKTIEMHPALKLLDTKEVAPEDISEDASPEIVEVVGTAAVNSSDIMREFHDTFLVGKQYRKVTLDYVDEDDFKSLRICAEL